MDRTLEVRTPESIAFSYELAGVGSRFLAVIVDLVIQVVLSLLLFWGLVAGAGHLPRLAHGAGVHDERLAYNLGVALLIAIVFAIFFGYFILFEALWNGQTPGKKLLGIRVVRDGGYPLDFMASLIRNLIRVGEAAVGFYAISAVTAVFSPENKRVGDLAAGTIVVRDSRMDSAERMLKDVVSEPVYAATAERNARSSGVSWNGAAISFQLGALRLHISWHSACARAFRPTCNAWTMRIC
jgi:uncharacterized RDD family membrane protein YckC